MSRTKMFLGLVFVVGLIVVFTNASPTVAPTTAPSTQPTSQPAKPINKFCAVEQDNPIDAKGGTYVYQGKTIGFCCPDCVDTFKKDPEKYMKTIK